MDETCKWRGLRGCRGLAGARGRWAGGGGKNWTELARTRLNVVLKVEKLIMSQPRPDAPRSRRHAPARAAAAAAAAATVTV
ncbi:hypothetical protein JYU34_003015 [Plutella xylostella]|uniref:Uncharacterized protein n=1 Tax=Plutella xylostella TaxID=51655 RepID=A0ABQ7QYY5_PLUXY|nr:hypothetical protein JYU34_003015 [Plutella xylostella]